MRSLQIGLLVVSVIVAGCGGQGTSAAPREGGPLRSGAPITLGISAKVGERFTFGAIYVTNPTDEPLTLTEVRWSKKPEEVRFLGSGVAGPDRPFSIGESARFPDPRLSEFVEPVAGYEITRAEADGLDTEILLGLSPTRPGRFEIDGVEVHYRSGTQHYVRRIDSKLVLCVVAKPPLGRECV